MKTITISDESAEILAQVIRDEITALNARIDLCLGLQATTEAEKCQHKAATLYHIKQKLERAK